MWELSFVVVREPLKDTHTDGVKSTSDHTSADLFFFFHPRKIFFNKPFELLLHKTNRLHFSVCVCTVMDHRRLDFVSCRTCSLRAVIYYSTHARKNVIYICQLLKAMSHEAICPCNLQLAMQFLPKKKIADCS